MPSESPHAGSSDLLALGRALRELRERRGVQQEAVGFDAGVGKNYVYMAELGRLNPAFVTLLGLARALGFSIVELAELYQRELDLIDPRAGHDVPACPTPEALEHLRNLYDAWAEFRQAAVARRARGRIKPWT
jgi:transcriptional regulator with XRE-family HTH domain